jgi:hypothetical protein
MHKEVNEICGEKSGTEYTLGLGAQRHMSSKEERDCQNPQTRGFIKRNDEKLIDETVQGSNLDVILLMKIIYFSSSVQSTAQFCAPLMNMCNMRAPYHSTKQLGLDGDHLQGSWLG